jgi:hypothetical protein
VIHGHTHISLTEHVISSKEKISKILLSTYTHVVFSRRLQDLLNEKLKKTAENVLKKV